jgi:hypothetical protein
MAKLGCRIRLSFRPCGRARARGRPGKGNGDARSAVLGGLRSDISLAISDRATISCRGAAAPAARAGLARRGDAGSSKRRHLGLRVLSPPFCVCSRLDGDAYLAFSEARRRRRRANGFSLSLPYRAAVLIHVGRRGRTRAEQASQARSAIRRRFWSDLQDVGKLWRLPFCQASAMLVLIVSCRLECARGVA